MCNFKVLGFPCPIYRFRVSNLWDSKFGMSNLRVWDVQFEWILSLPCPKLGFEVFN